MANTPRVKILILGEGGVGKTSLLSQYIDEQFKPTKLTVGIEYKQKIIKYQNQESLRIQVWDTAGTERYRTITPVYYKNVDGVLLVFDITDCKSFETINFWINELNEHSDISKIQLVLVGNKSDLAQKREISIQDANIFAKKIQLQYFETSAKNNDETVKVFSYLIEKILENKGIVMATQNLKLKSYKQDNSQKKNNCC